MARESSLAPGLIARPVRPVPFFIAASRDYLKRHGAPSSPEELAHHDFVAIGNIDAISLTGSQGKIEVPLRVVLRYRSMAGVPNAVAAGIGLAPLPDILFEEPEFKGILTPVLTDYPIQGPTLYIVYVSRKYLPLKIRALIDFFAQLTKSAELKPAARPLSSRLLASALPTGPETAGHRWPPGRRRARAREAADRADIGRILRSDCCRQH